MNCVNIKKNVLIKFEKIHKAMILEVLRSTSTLISCEALIIQASSWCCVVTKVVATAVSIISLAFEVTSMIIENYL